MESISVKVSFNGEMRRFPFQGASYKDLYEYVLTLLGLEPTTEVVLKYADEEGDLITISSDLELKSAIVPGKLLRLEASLRKAPQAQVTPVPAVVPTAPVQGEEQPAPMDYGQGPWYHHRRGPLSGDDWKAFKELRKKDKKAFSREEWAAYKEQFKADKKLMKEHWKKGHHGPHGPYSGPFGGRGGFGPRGGCGGPFGRGGRGGFGPHRGRGHHHGPHPHHAHGPHGHGPHHFDAHPEGANPEGEKAAPFVDLTPDSPADASRPPQYFGPQGGPGGFGFQGPFGGPFGGFPHHPPGFGFGFGCGRGKGSKLVARHVKDVTIDDGTVLAPGAAFVKTWRVRNEGAPWPAGCKLIFLSKHSGDNMGGPEFVAVEGAIETNQELDLSVNLTAPEKPGRYTGYWKMCAPDGRKFGQRVWVSIVVPSSGSSSSEGEKEADRYESLVDNVLAMGFNVKRHRVFRLLQKFNGDVSQVCAILAEKTQKRAAKEAKEAEKAARKEAKAAMMFD